MNSIFQDYKTNFLKEQQLTHKRKYVSDSDNELLYRKYYKSESDKNEVKKDYKIHEDSNGSIKFYTEVSEDISDEELSEYISMKVIQRLDGIDEKLYTIKNIMIFWFILTLVGVVGLIYTAIKLNGFFKVIG